MAKGPIYKVQFRRRREGRTDYRNRLALLKSGKTRMVVRPTLKHIIVQFVNYDEKGDIIVAAATSKDLKNLGWSGSSSNTPAAYLTALLAGRRVMKKGIKESVLDIGRRKATKGSVLFAALKGAIDAGIEVPHDESVIPSAERITGRHIDEKIVEIFESVKNKILEG